MKYERLIMWLVIGLIAGVSGYRWDKVWQDIELLESCHTELLEDQSDLQESHDTLLKEHRELQGHVELLLRRAIKDNLEQKLVEDDGSILCL